MFRITGRARLMSGVSAGALAAIAAGLACPATAANTPCSVSGGVATCDHDQSAGIFFSGGAITTVHVKNLSQPVTPANGVAGLTLQAGGGTAGGAAGPALSLDTDISVSATTNQAQGIILNDSGASGSTGATGTFTSRSGDDGQAGGAGGDLTVTNNGALTATGSNAIDLSTTGGQGGVGGEGYWEGLPSAKIRYGTGGTGGLGGAGGAITLTNSGLLTVTGDDAHGVSAISRGGGGNIGGFAASNGDASAGGTADTVQITNMGGISTNGASASALFGRSLGGSGSGGTYGGSRGARGGDASAVTISNTAAIGTLGTSAYGVFADSIGGFGGNGRYESGFSVSGGPGGAGGNAANVTVTDSGNIKTADPSAYGVFARSLGGTGGAGADAGGVVADSGSGGAGGNADSVAVTLQAGASIVTNGTGAYAIYAESTGGTGGRGGDAFGAVGDAAGGGAGGSGGVVGVINDGVIATSGDDAYGVLAVSKGSPGGYGGTGAGVVAFGGYGGGGSKGGAVTVTNNGTITTSGKIALGIGALSVGGGGGMGGVGGGLVAFGGGGPDTPPGCANGSASTDRSLCNDGGVVTVTNAGSIATSGEFSTAISAASIGGGGGDANEAVGAFSFGGTGGEGGDGNTVTVTNTSTGSILTTGDYARGIYASSVGGGGGFGGGALAIGLSTQVAVGGSGGNGGDGGFVNIANDGTITTQGEGAAAIFAESVGGGGGNGGDALAAGLSAFTLSIGGSGGGGGDGADVSVANTGTLNIDNDKSWGIFAQSVGGGGGNGGAGTSFGASPVVNIAVSLGGTGGDGGSGKNVAVTNSGTISTDGEDDVAVFAQSVGGGGGTGGAATAQGIAISAGDIPAVSVAFAMGGSGGGGGSGGDVAVTNSGTITTLGDSSHAIQAQSVGGGGGAGGDASALGTAMAFGAGSLKLTISLGGSGGGGGNGNAVTVTNHGSISTQGMASYGIFGQSVGAGGGAGGLGGASKPMLQKVGSAVGKYLAKKALGKSKSSGSSKNLQLNFSMGGSGGVAGDGGAVVIGNTSSIVTQGYNAFGILAQSVGGGGGAGGGGSSQSGGLVSSKAGLTSTLKASVALGGDGGASGNGGAVSVINNGSILTFGGDATAIFAQSIGGGGGISDTGADDGEWDNVSGQAGEAKGGGKLSSLSFLTFNVGGKGSASGSGGTVTVSQTGNVTTLGTSSFGIEAQSIGGGGGQGGDATNGYLGLLTLGGQGGAAGNGGDVNVTMKGDIVTAGTGSHGIMAQSVGGGGGMAGDVTGKAKTVDLLSSVPFAVDLSNLSAQNAPSAVKLTDLSFTLPSFVGLITGTQKGGGGGIGGTVNVTDTGNITTHGVGADGIFAQSIGGGGGMTGTSSLSVLAFMGSNGDSGNGGKVTVSHTGNITVTGNDASAIFAQSVGGSISADAATRFAFYGHAFISQNLSSFATGDDIAVTVAGGTFQGGGDTGAGIWIDNGLVNTITIKSDATVEALSGTAIKATANSGVVVNTVDNSGTVLGDVQLAGTSVNSFTNEAGAMLAPQTKVDLAGGTLINKGSISPGGAGVAATVAVNGNLNEAAGSDYIVDVGYGVGASDRIDVAGNATIAGTIAPHFTAITNQPVTLVTATGTLTNAGAAVVGNTPVVTFGLSFSSNALVLTTNADWTPTGANLNKNESGVGAYLQAIWNGGGSPALASVMGQLANLPSAGAYADALNHLSPGPYLTTLAGLDGVMTRFADNLMSCHGATGSLSPVDEQDCVWSEVSPDTEHQSASNGSVAYNGHVVRVQLGGQQHLDNDWVIGGSLGYDKWNRDVTGLALMNGEDFSAGAVAKYLQGPWVNALALTLDYGTFDSTRWISVPSTATALGNSDVLFAGIRGRSTYLFNIDPLYFKPYADLDIGYYHMDGFTEQGGGLVGLHIDGLDKAVVSFAPMLEVGTTQQLSEKYYLRPYVAAGISASTPSDWSVSASFLGAPSGGADMTVNQGGHGVLDHLIAGVEVLSTDDALLRLQYEARFAPHYTEADGLLKIGIEF